MNDWLSLRDYLRADIAQQLDDAILHHPDREMRAILAANRERTLEMLVDKAETAVLRRIMTDREQAEERSVPDQRVIKLTNGSGHVAKVQ